MAAYLSSGKEFLQILKKPWGRGIELSDYFSLKFGGDTPEQKTSKAAESKYVSAYETGLGLSIWASLPLHLFAQIDYYVFQQGYVAMTGTLYAFIAVVTIMTITAAFSWLFWWLTAKKNCLCAPMLVVVLGVLYMSMFVLSLTSTILQLTTLLPGLMAVFAGVGFTTVLKALVFSVLQVVPWAVLLPASWALSQLFFTRRKNGFEEAEEKLLPA